MPPELPLWLAGARRSLCFAVALLVAGSGRPVAAAPESPQRTVQEGTAVEFSLLAEGARKPGAPMLQEGQNATFRFRITNADSHLPRRDASPAAWVALQTKQDPFGKLRTAIQKAAPYLGGGTPMDNQEVDLNSYRVVVMNREPTLSVIDPRFQLGGSRLLALVELPSPASDWVLAPDQKTLYVALPGANAVAAVSTATWKITQIAKNLPGCRRVQWQPDHGRIWVTFARPDSEKGGVAVLQPDTLRRVATIETGAGPHTLAFRPDTRVAFVTNAASGTVSVIDAAKLAKIKDVKTGSKPGGAAYSTAGNMLYIPDAVDGTVSRLDGASFRLASQIKLAPGLGELAFTPRGRFALLLHPGERKIHVLDAAVGRVIQTGVTEPEPKEGATPSEPFQIAFSTKIAYVLDRTGESVYALPLDQIGREGKPIALAEIPAGRSALGAAGTSVHARMLVETPEAGAVLFANPRDAAIYYYQEGMAASKGSLDNARREGMAVLVVNHALREVAPGVYETTARLGAPGTYDVVFYLADPKVVHAFELKVTPDPALESARHPLAEVQPPTGTFTAGQKALLRFGVTRPGSKEPVDGVADMNILIRHTGSNWERHAPAESLGGGVYAVEFLPRAAGNYSISFESESLRLSLLATPPANLQVERAP